MLRRLLAVAAFAVMACTRPTLDEPIVANTGTARSTDGFEAAIATVEAGGYSIVERNEKVGFVRVSSKACAPSANFPQQVFLDFKAWKGSVDVRIAIPAGLKLDEPKLVQLLRERRELAWAVATRARLIAGEPIASSVTSPGFDSNYPGSMPIGPPGLR